ncbi:MAG: ABC transporter permease [Gammaproteobacteria bacterium RIFCSPHIGHO2_12_FULL_41_15]|nr:MAG: ABC transporter permease [Gammaproteobacteria bacterium RIFCSPHIGHO2_12_FULL_41_15]
MLGTVRKIGASSIDFAERIGQSTLFFIRSVLQLPDFRHVFSLLAQQIYNVGVLSLVIILLSGLFIGMVVALQGYHTLVQFAAEQQLGQLIALSVVRELGPVVTALLFAGRAGSSLTAELGLMRATEQISAMQMMAVDPISRVVSPRLWAGIISLPILTILFNLIAIYGGFLVGVKWLGVDGGSFWTNMQGSVNFQVDILNGIIKSAVFAVVITWIAVYQGYYSPPNSAGISMSTTKTVVYSSLMILGLDFVLTALMMGGW